MRRILAAALVALLCLAHVEATSAQSSNASVGGFVQDPSQAFIPGVSVTATNTQTGVVTTVITNGRTADFRRAALCVQAASSVVNLIAILAGRRDP